MANRKKKDKRTSARNAVSQSAAAAPTPEQLYERASALAAQGQEEGARTLYQQVEQATSDPRLKSLVRNDLAALHALRGDLAAAREGFAAALAIDADCQPARANLALLERELLAAPRPPALAARAIAPEAAAGREKRTKIAVLSFLFNWPSTGGGIVHTFELAQFLSKAGYAVEHFHARYPPWGIGGVDRPLPFASHALEFDDAHWNLPAIQDRFRQAVAAFQPDHVLITDSWNIKPHLAEAVRGYAYVLRFQAMECICPLNNVRLLADAEGRFRQCPEDQLRSPQVCADCVERNGRWSGALHRAERSLSGVGTPEYHVKLLRSLREAEAVLVVNPVHAAILRPYARNVRVVTSGMDPARFPWPQGARPNTGKVVLLFAGLLDEVMKGFAVVHEACAQLWQRRQDFELVATADPPGQADAFTRFVGWQSQEDLPRQLQAADVLVMPTIAQEALGRTAVEAMAAGRPVIASRLGGLPFTVVDGTTGLLFEPGDAGDLAAKIARLLDDAALRERLGKAGRRRFEEHYSWDVIIDRHYRPLLGFTLARPSRNQRET